MNIERFFAEDIATMFELKTMGVHMPMLGQIFDVDVNVIESVIDGAERKGFKLYPMRPIK